MALRVLNGFIAIFVFCAFSAPMQAKERCKRSLAYVKLDFQAEKWGAFSPRGKRTFFLNAKDRAPFEIFVENGMLKYRQNGEGVDSWERNFSGPAFFALSKRGKLYVLTQAQAIELETQHPDHVIHHSSLLDGEPVLSVGNMYVFEGRLLAIDDASGHYEREPTHLLQGLEWLSSKGVDLREVIVGFSYRPSIEEEYLERAHNLGISKIQAGALFPLPMPKGTPSPLPSDAFLP